MGGGGGESKSETTYAPAASYMPAATLESMQSYSALPTSQGISYGGNQFQMPLYAPLKAGQALTAAYSPQPVSQTMTQSTAPQMQGCCFNFMEAEGDVAEDVRTLRDNFIPKDGDIAKGYKIMASYLVPKMREDGKFKQLIREEMTQPIIQYAQWRNGKNDYGFIYEPTAKKWLDMWEKIGKAGLGREYTWEEFYDKLYSS